MNLEELARLTRDARHARRRIRELPLDHPDRPALIAECLRLRTESAVLRHGIWGRAAAAR